MSVCYDVGGSRDDSVEPSNLGDQFDLKSFPSNDTVSSAWDETDSARQTGGERDFICNSNNKIYIIDNHD